MSLPDIKYRLRIAEIFLFLTLVINESTILGSINIVQELAE